MSEKIIGIEIKFELKTKHISWNCALWKTMFYKLLTATQVTTTLNTGFELIFQNAVFNIIVTIIVRYGIVQ